MSFTVEKLFPTKGDGATKAFGTVVYNGVCQIKVSVVSGKNGLFVSLPREKYTNKEGKETWDNKVYFTDKAVQQQLNDTVVAAYNAQVGGGSTSQGRSPEPTSQTPGKNKSVPF